MKGPAAFPRLVSRFRSQLGSSSRADCRPTLITTTFDGRLHWLQDLVSSLDAFTPRPFELIVVDNGTTDGTREYLSTLSGVTTIRNEENLDDTRGVNQALRLARTEHIVKIDTDALIASNGWWQATCQYMKENPGVGIAGDVVDPGFYLPSRLYREGWSPTTLGNDGRAHVQGGFMVLRKETLEQIGFFNEDYPHGGMDVEISFRALSYGWKLGNLSFVRSRMAEQPYSPKIKVFHPVWDSPLRIKIMRRVRSTLLKRQFIGSSKSRMKPGF